MDKLREKDIKIDELRNESINIINVTQNSSNKGAKGETIYKELLQEITPDVEIIEKNKTNQNCDIEIRNDNVYSLHEVKYYKNSVNIDEINKLHTDIKINKPDYAVLASLSSSISNKKNFSIDIIDNCLVIYLTYVQKNPENIKLACLIGETFARNRILNDTKLDTIKTEILKAQMSNPSWRETLNQEVMKRLGVVDKKGTRIKQ